MNDVGFLARPGNDDFIVRCAGAGSPPMVGFVGAGGKTTTLFWLARALAARGRRVVVTTTTRMYRPDSSPGLTVLIEADFGRRVEMLRSRWHGVGIAALFSALDPADNKVAGCLEDEVDALRVAGLADTILVEADGARHCLIKAPAAHEPCIPGSSENAVVALCAGAALARPADPANIHRWPQFAAITGLAAGDLVGREAMRRLLAHPEGMFKNAPPRARCHWLVNVRDAVDASLASLLAALAAGEPRLDGLWAGDMRQDNPFSHAWVRGRGQK